ncbi:glycosyltransferase involved in cell wall biosynthesis [Motilibacter peucedani]|uniref:Glycosyltransferase involved in cell wall biosynthesis n=1 Tax=Motilibacter peucedani TaxID=598650 RepID=A0A420XSH7_9ACTN|nr:glycosyltransferase family 4 protein [Motilibacter peucedani]RKS77855.1 glycosyltransferase involved in cell wall biosynthesis [Motilibacter peucedani]
MSEDRALDVRLVLGTSAGGVGSHVRSLVRGLAGEGDTVRVLGPESTERRFAFSLEGAAFDPVEIGPSPRPLEDARTVRRLRRLLEGADVVHAHGLRAGMLAGLALRDSTPLVVTWHNAVLARGPRGALIGRMERYVAGRAAVTLAVSPDLVERVRELGGGDVRLAEVVAAPMPSALRTRAEVRAELGAGAAPLILAVGRLAPQKAYPVLLAAARLWRDRPGRPLTVVAGDGPLRAQLQRRISQDGLAVRLLGQRDDVPDLLAAADVVVLSSQWEGRPLVVEEALRAGTPLVATSVGGVPAMVGDAALLVPPDDPSALAAAVTRVLDDPELADRLRRDGALRAAGFPTEHDSALAARRVYAQLVGVR